MENNNFTGMIVATLLAFWVFQISEHHKKEKEKEEKEEHNNEDNHPPQDSDIKEP